VLTNRLAAQVEARVEHHRHVGQPLELRDERLMEDPDTPHAVKLAAARDLLDRNDITGKTAVEVTVKPREAIIDGILVDTPDAARVAAVIDAELEPVDPDSAEVEVEPDRAALPVATTDSRPPRRLDPQRVGQRSGETERVEDAEQSGCRGPWWRSRPG
jgi:hypothetical protein